MKYRILLTFYCLFLITSCDQKTSTIHVIPESIESDFIIAFGSCNKQYVDNLLWQEVVKNDPNIWIWGGDNIYSDTTDMSKMEQDYQDQINQTDYSLIHNEIEVLGTWDDHDYGQNDAGIEYPQKMASQDLFLDFMQVAENDPRRARFGVYHAKSYTTPQGSIKVIILDTRYFRDPIEKINGVYQQNLTGSILGEDQWAWFENELSNSTADFNIIVSSIQFLSSEHRFEKWANFPNEVIRFENILVNSGAKGTMVISGDRHLSEFSKANINGLGYPLVDFTSSGLTHSYTNFTSEANSNRIGNVISSRSFGLIYFDFSEKKLRLQMRGINNLILQEHIQVYP